MIFAAPINTDAPIYYWPKATLGLIIAQLVVFLAVLSASPDSQADIFAKYALQYGQGLHPVQWVTSNFLHGGWLHLLGNAFFLWGLGLVVEGKLGWQRFLLVFFGIGVLECAIEQACLQGLSGGSFGSSSILFGLLSMALLWAPVNEFTFGYVSLIPMLFRFGTFDLSIQWFAVLEFVQEGVLAWFNGFRPASEILHLAGAALGFGLGWTMLRQGWVDCEGWDLLSRLRAKRSDAARAKSRTKARPALPQPVDSTEGEAASGARRKRAIKQIRSLLEEGRALPAWTVLQRMRHLMPDWTLPDAELTRLAEELARSEHWEESVELYSESVTRNPEQWNLRLDAAEIMVSRLSRPQAGLKLLQPIDPKTLDAVAKSRFVALRAEALRLIDSGVMEFERRR
jgi:membrane associated rhomboid family serine protease